MFRTSLAERSPEQRDNIQRAATALDGAVLEPGEEWSFNRRVGPRTPERGYCKAPAFLEQDLTESVGGGICQVSSTVYNAAALAGLGIVERHPHQRRVQSVPPGRDATVWYGKADLRLVNRSGAPVRLSARVEDEMLTVRFWGDDPGARSIRLQTYPVAASLAGRRVFRTVRQVSVPGAGSQQETLSEDAYVTATGREARR
ncbi:MAG TPA: VanW family protein [Stenomitos sp.]